MEPTNDNAPEEPAKVMQSSLGSASLGDEDENWSRRAWEMFTKVATRGVVDSDRFVVWAAELNVECDIAAVHRVIPKDNWNRISYEAAIKALEVIPTLAMNDEVYENEEEVNENLVTLGFFDYIWTVWMCGEADPEKTYQMSVSLKLSPRFWLLFNASLVFIFVSGAILLLMSLLWLDTSMSRELTVLRQLQTTLQFMTDAIADFSLEISGKDVLDEVATLSRWLEQLTRDERADLQSNLYMEALRDANLLGRTATAAIEVAVSEMYHRMEKFGIYSDANALGIPILLGMTKKWLAKSPGWDAVLYNTQTSSVQWASFNDSSLPHFTGSDVFGKQLPLLKDVPCIAAFDNISPTDRTNPQTLQAQGLGPQSGENTTKMVYRFFPRENIGICLAITRVKQSEIARYAIAEAIDIANEKAIGLVNTNEYSSVRIELMLGAMHDQVNQGTGLMRTSFSVLTTPTFEATVCGNPALANSCNTFESHLYQCWVNKTNCIHETIATPYYTTDYAFVAVHYLEDIDAVLSHSILISAVEEDNRERLLRVMNSMNRDLTHSTLEIGVAARDELGKIVPQITDFKFVDTCFVKCERIPESVTYIVGTFETQDSGYAVYHDYRPAPVVGGFSYVKEGMDSTLTVERDVTEVRMKKLDELTSAFDDINTQFKDSTEIVLFRQQGMPVSRVFDITEPCPPNVICVEDETLGMLARTDCIDCLRKPTDLVTTVKYNTQLRSLSSACPTCNVSHDVFTGINNAMTEKALTEENIEGEVEMRMKTDYANTVVNGYYGFVPALSTYLMVKRDNTDVVDPVIKSISTLVGVAAGLVFIGVLGLVLLSRRTLNRIEGEWRRYKHSIEAEKEKFDLMIKEIVPAAALARFRRGQKCVADSQSALSYAYMDICGFSEKTRGKSAKEVVRTVAYYFILSREVAQKCRLFRLKTFGDASVFVGGLDQKGSASKDMLGAQSAYACATFAGFLIQLVSSVYAHYPQRLSQLSQVFKGEPDVPLQMLPIRIGLHTGPVVTGLVDVGNTPFYEHYGATLALCHRLQATCQPNKAHVSSVFKELVESVDAHNVFEFDTLRKTMVKGRGTITSYPIRSVQLPIDEYLLSKMKIKYAQHMFNFMFKSGQKIGKEGGTSYTQSQDSGTTGGDQKTTSSDTSHTNDTSEEFPSQNDYNSSSDSSTDGGKKGKSKEKKPK